MIQRLFFLVYQLLFMPALVILALTIGLLNRKVRQGLGERLNLRKIRRAFKERPIWIHASSGEFEYAKAIIRELKKTHPAIPILVTYFSTSYKKQIIQFQGVDHAEPLPLDLPGPVSDFLRFYRPRLALFARTDLWPELLRQTKRSRIPSLLFSCTRPPLKGWRRLSAPIYTIFYSLLDQIHCVSSMDQNHLRQLTTTPTLIAGDTRYDQVAFRLAQARDFSQQILPATLPRLIAGSTWPQDEAVLLKAVEPLIKKQKLQLILVPHEPTPSHLAHLQKNLQDLGLSSVLLSETSIWSGSQVLLIDQMGILADLYAYADFAFVGGSFKSKVHSVMEPLGAGLPVVVGPHFENNREATEFKNINIGNGDKLNTLTAVQSVNDAEQMQLVLTTLAALSASERRQIKLQLEQEFKHRQGASEQVLKWLHQHNLELAKG